MVSPSWKRQRDLFRYFVCLSVVNFTSILFKTFSHKSALHSFSLIMVWLCDFLLKEYQRKSCSKMLMKLTTEYHCHETGWILSFILFSSHLDMSQSATMYFSPEHFSRKTFVFLSIRIHRRSDQILCERRNIFWT